MDRPPLLATSGDPPTERNVRWLGFVGAIRATGMSLIASFFVLGLPPVLDLVFAEIGILAAVVGDLPLASVNANRA